MSAIQRANKPAPKKISEGGTNYFRTGSQILRSPSGKLTTYDVYSLDDPAKQGKQQNKATRGSGQLFTPGVASADRRLGSSMLLGG